MKKMLIALFILLFLLSEANTYAVAVNDEFVKDNIEINEQKKIISKLDITQIEKAPKKSNLICFAVSDVERIAVGSELISKKYVSVYDKSGVFLYGYEIKTDGKFGVGWNENYLIIFLVRDSVAITVNDHSEILSCKKPIEPSDGSYWSDVFATQRNQNGNSYKMKNESKILSSIASSYSVLERTDTNGNTTLICDNSSEFAIRQITKIILVTLFLVAVILILFRRFKSRNRKI